MNRLVAGLAAISVLACGTISVKPEPDTATGSDLLVSDLGSSGDGGQDAQPDASGIEVSTQDAAFGDVPDTAMPEDTGMPEDATAPDSAADAAGDATDDAQTPFDVDEDAGDDAAAPLDLDEDTLTELPIEPDALIVDDSLPDMGPPKCDVTDPDACDDGDPCTDDACDPTTGCMHTPVADGMMCAQPACADGLWSAASTCAAGKCQEPVQTACDDGNPCTTDACEPIKGCLHTASAGACDDGNACTLGDACDAGVCMAGMEKPVCDDTNVCTIDACVPASGCTHDPVPDGAACSTPACQGLVWQPPALCAAGACGQVPSTEPCDDGNVCTLDSCAAESGCFNAPAPAGTTCDDGNPCTLADACTETLCAGGGALTCDDGDPCTDDGCDPASGCATSPNSAACDDGNGCTEGDACAGGACAPGNNVCGCQTNADCGSQQGTDLCAPKLECVKTKFPYVCEPIPDSGVVCDTSKDPPCMKSVCEPSTGLCEAKPTGDGGPCDDTNPCTTGEACSAGACGGGSPTSCDDANPCTDDGCDPKAGGCTHTPNTAPCDVGNKCTYADQCSGGLCKQGKDVECTDANPCTDDGCNPKTGCTHVPNAATCEDGNKCTAGDFCKAGACHAGAATSCDDGNPCTVDACSALIGCSHDLVKDGTACAGTNPCFSGFVCAEGSCIGKTATLCDDKNPCTTDACDAVKGCVYTPVTTALPCEDGNLCTIGDKCSGATCKGGTAANCNDSNPCTTDSCDAGKGCINAAASGAACNDNNATTLSDHCQSGTCAGTPSPLGSCNDSNPCTVDYKSSGPFGGGFCTVSGYAPFGTLCVASKCVGTVYYGPSVCGGAASCNAAATQQCDDANPCTTDVCVPNVGCLHLPASGAACNDGDPCTTGDICHAGMCVGAVPTVCADGNLCTQDVCVTGKGCGHAALEGTPCSDANGCTAGDACKKGGCSPGAPPSCDDANPCTLDSCSAGKCVFKPSGATDCCVPNLVGSDFEAGLDPSLFTLDNSSGASKWQLATGLQSKSGKNALYYGNLAKNTFDDGTTSGTATLAPFTLLPFQAYALNFSLYMDTEPGTSYDRLTVSAVVGTQSVLLWNKTAAGFALKTWKAWAVDLSAFAGLDVAIAFHFDTVDPNVNVGQGVFIDDVSLTTTCATRACAAPTDCGDGLGATVDSCAGGMCSWAF